MIKPTLLYVEESKSSLSQKVIERKDIQLVLLRFKQNMFFDKLYLQQTSHIPCFIFNKENKIEDEVIRFKDFCLKNNIVIDYFYNDSEYHQEMIQKFAHALNLSGSLSEDQALCVRDKAVMKDRLQTIGYRTMAYEEVVSIKDVTAFAEKCGGLPVIVKWRRGLSSKEVYKINDINSLGLLNIDLSKNRYIVERYCSDLIWCVDSIIQDGKVMATFYAWLPYTNLSFAETKEKFAQITVSQKPEMFKFDGGKLTQNIVNELELKNGYMHLEAFVDNFGHSTICEFAWRTPGEHMLLNHSLAFGIDVYSLLIDVMVGKKTSLTLKGKKCVGDMFLPIKNGTILDISSYEDIKNIDGVIDGEVLYKIGDKIESKRQYTSCSGWIQVIGDSKDEVLNRMTEVYKNFKIETKDPSQKID